MKEKLQLAVKSEFVKKLGILLASGSVAQLIPVALSFFISRNFTADSLAVYGLYFSIVSIVAVLATGKFEAALLVPKSLKEAGHLYVLGVISVVVVSTVTAVLSFFFDHEIAELLGNQGLVDIFWLIPVAIAIVGFYQLNSYMYIRFGKIKGLAMQKLSQRGAEGVSILITGYRSISNGLIFSDIIGRAGLLIISGLAVKPYFIHHTKITWQGLKSGFKNYKKYPISFAPSSVANALSMHLALFVISANYSEDLTGQFNFVRFVLSLPITFLGQSLSQVLLERFSAKARNRISIKADVLKLTGVLSLLALGFTSLARIYLSIFLVKIGV